MSNNEPIDGRCNAQTRDGGYCANYPVDGRDRCRMHGGAQPRGTDSPNAIHGLRSDYLTEEDEAIYDEVRQHDNAELVQEEIWMIKTKLLRAAREAGGEDGQQLAKDMLAKIEAGEADEDVVDALANLLQTSEGAVDRALGRLNDLVKTHHKITEGETHHHEHAGEGGGGIIINTVATDGDE